MVANQDELIQSLNRIFDDIDPKTQFPAQRPLLAHYTTLQIGESILNKKQFWLSNPLYMNDFEELAFGFREGNKLVAASTELRAAIANDDIYDRFRFTYDSYAKKFEDEEALDVFIGCFCKHEPDDTDGALSMWRGYGHDGKGLALIFDTSKIDPPKSSALILAPIHYASSEDRIEYLRSRIVFYCEILKEIAWEISNIHLAAHILFERIKMYALFTKHIGFQEEREWRILYSPSRDQLGALKSMVSYYNGPRGIEPKMFMEIGAIEGVTSASFDFDNLIKTILLGPNGASVLAETSFKRMLNLTEKQHLVNNVRSSRIPYRPLPRI